MLTLLVSMNNIALWILHLHLLLVIFLASFHAHISCLHVFFLCIAIAFAENHSHLEGGYSRLRK